MPEAVASAHQQLGLYSAEVSHDLENLRYHARHFLSAAAIEAEAECVMSGIFLAGIAKGLYDAGQAKTGDRTEYSLKDRRGTFDLHA